MNKRIGLFGGTFDPIHFGHLSLAVDLYEKNDLDEVWVFPAGISPFKQDQNVTDAERRLEMTRLAVEPYPHFKVREDEVRREGVSYAIDTVRLLLEEASENAYSIFLGSDAAAGVSRWKEVDELVQLVDFFVGWRPGTDLDHSQLLAPLQKGITPTRALDISSTEIRERFKKGLCSAHLLPEKVIDYIVKHQLYS